MMKKILLLILTVSLGAFFAHGDNNEMATKVYDFLPAPGQFVNVIPKCNQGDSRETVIAAAQKALCGYISDEDGSFVDPTMISLGAYGGYVVFGFDHPIVNVEGQYDLYIKGNAFQAQQSTSAGGSSEPGIVMVSRDVNGNGIPDDPWYELAGSEYHNSKTQHNYRIVYYKPDDLTKAVDVAWTSNDVDSLQAGVVNANAWHHQPYWPLWVTADSIVFEGAKLPCNAVDESGNGTYWVQHFFDWGYVDNRPNTDTTACSFKIEWAVDAEGNAVHLPYVDFIKVYNGLNQMCGWLGETSTEVAGAIDLHPDAPVPTSMRGDLNGDWVLDQSDVDSLINVILGIATAGMEIADVNGDGKVDVSDVTALINAISK